jgi:hypothetical protein
MDFVEGNSSRPLKKTFIVTAATIVIFVLTVGLSRAQTGSIQGTVLDQKERTLPGATVVVENPNTGLSRGTTTDSDGGYRFLSLPPGTYQVEVSFTGYQTVRKEGIQLRIDQNLRVDFQLQQATVELEEVQVVAQTQAIQMDNPAVATPITAAQIENQPTFSRNLMELGKLVPGGRSRDGGAADFGSGSSEPGTQTQTGAVFGDFVIDGVSWKDRSAGAPLTGDKDNSFLSQEAVQEMRFITNGYDAKYRGGTAVTVVETRRGSNTFEGSFFTKGFSSELRSKGPFQEGSVPDASRFQWGGYLSGPILEDKLFFNVVYEEEEEQDPVSFTPGSDVWSEFAGTQTFTQGSRLVSAGLTGRPSQDHSIELTGHFWRSGHPNHLGGAVTEDWGWTRNQKMSVYQLRHLYTPTSNITNDLSLVHQRRQWFTQSLSDEPTRVFPGIQQGPLNFLWPLKQNDNITKAVNHFTYALDDHILKAGGTVGYSNLDEWWPRLRTPALIYGVDDPDADPILAQVGVGRNVLQGDASDPTNTESAKIRNDTWLLSFYAQDDWDVGSGLTLSLGLRWSASPGHLNNDFTMAEDFATKLRDAGVPENYIAEGDRNDDLDNFAPRLRFSWDVFGEGKTTINGGYARSYDRPPSNDVDREQRDANWLLHTIIFNNNPTLPDGATGFPEPTEDPEKIRQLVVGGQAALQPNLTLLRKNIEYPETDDYSIGIKHQFTPEIRASLNFVAKNSRNGFGSWNFNPLQGGQRAETAEFGDVFLSGNFWDRQYRAALLSVRREYRDDWMLQFNYALSETNTDVMRPNSSNPFDGVAGSGDERHRFTLNGIYNLPYGFRISGFATIASPTPLNATDGRDLNQDGSFDNDYLGGQPFNYRPSGFDEWYRKIDLRLSKSITYRGVSAELQAEVFNVLNTDNYSDYFVRRRNAQGELISRFGEPVSAYSPRRVQLGVRMSF